MVGRDEDVECESEVFVQETFVGRACRDAYVRGDDRAGKKHCRVY